MSPLSPEESRAALRQLEEDWLEALGEIKAQNAKALHDVRRFAHAVAVGLVVTLAGVIVSVVAGVAVVGHQSDRADQNASQAQALAHRVAGFAAYQQRSRRAAILSSCRQRNETNAGIVQFVVAVAPDLEARVRRTFVVLDCDAYVDRILRP